jgi:hypothetical protein
MPKNAEHDLAITGYAVSMDSSSQPDSPPYATSAKRQADLFAATAKLAEGIADTAEESARVHAEMRGTLPGAEEHAERDTRLAAAERAAAEHLRRGEVPPEDVRAVIREVRQKGRPD